MRSALFTSLMLGTALVFSAPAHAQDAIAPIRSITVNGEAHRQVAPDEAHVVVSLNGFASKMAEAKSTHDARLKKLLDITRNADIPEKKVATQASNVQPVYSYSNDAKDGRNIRHFDGYRVTSTIDITVSDTGKLGDLLDAITNANLDSGNNPEWGNLISLNYTLSEPEKVSNDLLADAIDNARSKANRMADAADAVVGRVYEIREGGTPRFTPMPVAFAAAAPMMAKATIAPPAGEQEVSASVTVTYELK